MKYNPEHLHFDESKEILDTAHDQARKVTIKNEIQPADFVDLYSEAGVKKDMAFVDEMEERFEQEDSPEDKNRRQLAEILEAIIFEQGEQSDWFGDKVTTIKTSRFDDIAGGVDMIAEFDEGRNRSSQAAFAIDATYSRAVGEKFKKIKGKIDSGQLARVKYFQSENSPFRGELSRVPITVASAHPRTVRELARLWVDNDKKALANHWIQFQFLEELEAQCQIFSDYAEKIGQPAIAQSYRHIGDITKDIIKQKHQTIKDAGQRDNNFQQTLSDLRWLLQ